ncbi:MAG: SMP-30/gluconolactonase/LRE family protein, partial [Caulobacteraceae bacterium]
MHIRPDGRQELVLPRDGAAGALPNGLAFSRQGDLLIADFGRDVLASMTRDGRRRTLCDSIEGAPLGKVNFVLRDRRDRLWFTVSTRLDPWARAVSRRQADGYVAVLDERGARIVADGFAFANEIRFDADEQWLYVAETCAKRVTRLRVRDDGSLEGRETYGPSSLGSGALDGIAFDVHGNLWAAMIFSDRLVAITPQGDLLTLLEDGDKAAAARFDAELDSGEVVSVATMQATGGRIAPWLTGLTFGGPDLRTVYLGSVKGQTVPFFRSPVAGLPMVHWR